MITQTELKSNLHYCQESGEFTWLVNRGSRGKAGKSAGCVDGQGYITIRINGVQYNAHRLAWLYMTGQFPTAMIDHVNMVKSDNRWANLREADKSKNALNKPAQRNNKLGIKGVCWVKSNKKFRASTTVGGKIYRAEFDTIEDAAAAYDKMRNELHGEFKR